MNRLLPLILLTFILVAATAVSGWAQEDFRVWEPKSGVALRQGYHIEWFRGGEARDVGQLAGEVGFVWSDCRNGDRGVFLQIIGTDGNQKFENEGLQVADTTGRQEDPGVWPDPTDGGWFVAWEDFDADSLGDIFCTKIDRNGNKIWGDNERGVAVCVYPGIQESVRMTQDGQGGVIIAWRDMRGGDTGDIYAMHVLSDGRLDPDWPENGLEVVGEAGAQTSHTADIDGAGGMIIGWKDGREVANFDIWAQRITPDGDLLWGEGRGVPICNNQANQESPKLCPDGNGGAFFSWVDERNADQTNKDIYVQRVDENGELMWSDPEEGEPLCTANDEQLENRIIISEAGTAIVSWEDRRADGVTYDVYAQRITGDNRMRTEWDDQGVPVVDVERSQRQSRMYPDGQGGAYFVWEDERVSGFPEIDLWAQRINVNGQRVWAEEGVLVAGAAEVGDEGYSTQQSPLVRRTADGGCTIAWADFRTGSIHLYAQRLTPNGENVWDMHGVPVAAGLAGNAIHQRIYTDIGDQHNTFAVSWLDGRFGARGTVPFLQFCRPNENSVEMVFETDGIPVISDENLVGGGIAPHAAASSDGGMLVVWEDHRQGADYYAIYAQKIMPNDNPDQRLLWGETGTKCADFDDVQNIPKVCSDRAGGAIVAWRAPTPGEFDYYDIYMQRINADGEKLWGDEGIMLTGNDVDETMEDIIPDGEGGAVVLWVAHNQAPRMNDDLYIERVNANGEPQWGGGGVPLAVAEYKQHDADLVRHQNGYFIVWVDGRDDELGQSQDDIFGQFIQYDGTMLWRDNGYFICGDEYNQHSPSATVDNRGYLWIAWEDSRFSQLDRKLDIFIQKLNYHPDQNQRPQILLREDGEIAYDGIAICAETGDQVEPQIEHDGRNGVYVVWEDYRSGVWSDIYMQHLQPDATPYNNWHDWGNVVCDATHKQNLPYVGRSTVNGYIGAIVTWEDKRATGKEELSNTFVQRVDDRILSTPMVNTPAHPNGYALESVYPNPFNSQTLITFVNPREAEVRLSVYDISGRFVKEIANDWWAAGRHVMLLDGSKMAAGMYIVRMEANDVQLEKQLHLVK